MKKVALAALALALVPAACQAPLRSAHADAKWWFHFRSCTAMKANDADAAHQVVTLDLDDVRELQKLIPNLRRCTAFWQCVADREAGKVKHCYENDRRWRAP
jgi:hypothetical protein